MKIIGIDYGRKKVGIAVGVNGFAEPLKVIHYKEINSLMEDIKKASNDEGAEKIVVGVSEGDMARESLAFGEELSKYLGIPVTTFDETLSSKDAVKISIEAGVRQKKRREMEDAYAACLMLQNYLDSNPALT